MPCRQSGIDKEEAGDGCPLPAWARGDRCRRHDQNLVVERRGAVVVVVSQAWHAFPNIHTGSPFIYGGHVHASPAMSTTVSPLNLATHAHQETSQSSAFVLGQQYGPVLDVPMNGTGWTCVHV